MLSETEKIGRGLPESDLYPFQKEGVHGSDIAGELRVSRPTVSASLKALAEEGYVFVDDTHEIHLTERGRRVAEDTYERNSTFRKILTGLGVDEKTAAADACEMEHAVSRESYEALKKLFVQMEAFHTLK